MKRTYLTMLTGIVAIGVLTLASSAQAQTTDAATYVERHVIQGNFQSGSPNVFLEANNNGRRLGAGGAQGQNRVNNPVIQYTLPTLTDANILSAQFTIDLDTPAVTSAAAFDVVATLMNASDVMGITDADFNDDSTDLGNGSLIAIELGTAVVDGGTLTFDFGTDGLTLLQSFYSGVTPNQTDAFIRISAATPHEYLANVNDRYNFLTADGTSNGALVTTFDITTGTGTTPLKGDVDLSGVVDFADIPAFIAVLQGGGFQAEADCDCNTVVDFADIPAFIAILQGG